MLTIILDIIQKDLDDFVRVGAFRVETNEPILFVSLVKRHKVISSLVFIHLIKFKISTPTGKVLGKMRSLP